MSTRGFIGLAAGDRLAVAYNHSDSYPSGLGLDVLAFVRQLVKDGPAAIESARQRVGELKIVNEDDTPIPQEVEALKGWLNSAVGGTASKGVPSWYQLLRETQGNPDAMLSSGYVLDASEFPLDSLFCEWGYVIDFEAQTIEVYKGFREEVSTEGRWAGVGADTKYSGYYPVERVGLVSFAGLPDDDGFVRLFEADDEE